MHEFEARGRDGQRRVTSQGIVNTCGHGATHGHAECGRVRVEQGNVRTEAQGGVVGGPALCAERGGVGALRAGGLDEALARELGEREQGGRRADAQMDGSEEGAAEGRARVYGEGERARARVRVRVRAAQRGGELGDDRRGLRAAHAVHVRRERDVRLRAVGARPQRLQRLGERLQHVRCHAQP